jgi:hypothetical protein
MDHKTQQVEQQDAGVTRERSLQVKRPYRAPEIMVMNDKEVLKVFQITSAGISWWG